MKIKTVTGTILESTDPLVTEQWRKQGYQDVIDAVKPDKPATTGKRRNKE